jgi:hypothetical protein
MKQFIVKNCVKEIKQLLVNLISEAHLNKIIGNNKWTFFLKEKLAILGESYNFQVSVGGFKDDYNSEWLFDLVWFKEEVIGDNSRLIDIPLVVESEWGIKLQDIKYDFEKLLVSRAAIRLMICESSKINLASRIEYFKDAVNMFKMSQKGDFYLIAILLTDTEEFHFEEITF